MAKKRATGNIAEKKMINKLKELEEFEDFKESLLPAIRGDMKAGMSAEAMLRKYQAYAAGRLITIVAQEKDSGKAIQASKEVLDRTIGKPTEKVEVTTTYDGLKDQELDSLLKTKLGDMKSDTKSKH